MALRSSFGGRRPAGGRARAADAAHEDVHAAEALEDFGDHTVHAVGGADVGSHEHGSRSRRRCSPRCGGDRRPGVREAAHDGCADPFGAPGDEGALPRELARIDLVGQHHEISR
jgi:hypothetical protein